MYTLKALSTSFGKNCLKVDPSFNESLNNFAYSTQMAYGRT